MKKQLLLAVILCLSATLSHAAAPKPSAPAMTVVQLVTMVQSQISKCWDVPKGVRVSQDNVITVLLHLNRDGTLSEPPLFPAEAQETKASGSDYPYLKKAAIKAITDCTPLRLPAASYKTNPGWDTIDLHFNTK